jgi:hypothetical protein
VALAKRPRPRAIGYGALSVLVAGIAITATLWTTGWSLSALPRVDSNTKLGAVARALDPGFHTVHPGAYDGQFYWGIAVDPLATGAAHRAFDKASYRYGHPLYGWLAWLLSAGQARAVPAALALVGLASLFAAATIAAMLGLGRGGSGWEGLFVALNPGLIISTDQDLAEPLATALLLGAFAAHVRGRLATTWACLALLPLVKEPLGLVLAAVVAWELVHRRRERAAILATAAVPALAWWSYARIHLGAWFTSGGSALGRPLAGWRSAFFDRHLHLHESVVRRDAAVALLVALLAVLAFAAVRALRLRSPIAYGYLGLAAVVVCLAPNAVIEFSTALRNTAFLVVLLPFVLTAPALRPRGDGATEPVPRGSGRRSPGTV